MEQKTKVIVIGVREKLLEDLPVFLGNPKKFSLTKKIDGYCSDALKNLEGLIEPSPDFSEFINILYGCQQLDDFGELWAPTKKKLEKWLDFLEKLKV